MPQVNVIFNHVSLSGWHLYLEIGASCRSWQESEGENMLPKLP